jgi:Toprim domain-containing protein
MIADGAVTGVHLTRLAVDGSCKAGTERDKIMVGNCRGSPIVLAPVNDLLGLVVAEGIEDTLSTVEATGLGGWAAESAAHMPALADAIPRYVECVTIIVDDDRDGRRHAARLAELVAAHGTEIRQSLLAQTWSAAA